MPSSSLVDVDVGIDVKVEVEVGVGGGLLFRSGRWVGGWRFRFGE